MKNLLLFCFSLFCFSAVADSPFVIARGKSSVFRSSDGSEAWVAFRA